jgi:hypothetical protein
MEQHHYEGFECCELEVELMNKTILRMDGKIQRCQYVVYRRDTYRYDGRGPGGFSLHYNEGQCSFKAVEEAVNTYGNPIKLCSRHLKRVKHWCMSPTHYDQPWEPRDNEQDH